MRRGKVLSLDRVLDDVPGKASQERAHVLQAGYKSGLTIPLAAGGSTLGVLTFITFRTERSWSEEVVQRLRLVGEILTNALVRRRTEKVLRESEQRYRHIFETTGVSIWEEDFTAVQAAIDQLRAQGVTGFRNYFETHPEFVQQASRMVKVIDVNEATLKMFGATSKEELLGALDQVFVPETQEIFGQEITAIAEGRDYFEGETINQTLQGERRNVLLTMAIPSKQEKLDSVLVTLFDITERKRAEEALREREATLESILRAAPVGIGLVVNRVLMQINDRCCDMVGRSRQELLGQNARILYPNDKEYEYVGKYKYEQIRAKGTGTVETRWQRKDGTVIDVLLSSTPLDPDDWSAGVMFSTLDITERKQVERALAKRNQALGLLNRASQVMTATLDMDQVLALTLSEVCQLLGVDDSSIWLAEPRKDHSTPELICRQAVGPQSEIVRGWRLAAGEGLVGWVFQRGESLIVADAQQDERHFSSIGERAGAKTRSLLSVPLKFKGDVIGVLQAVDTQPDRFSSDDLTLVESLAATVAIAIENARLFAQEEQRSAELARTLKQQKELEQLRTELIQNISHELRTPLAIARGYAELLYDGTLGELRPDQREPVSIITRRTQMLSKMMDDIAAIVEVDAQASEQKAIDLVELVQSILADFQGTAQQSGLNLVAEIVPEMPPVMGNPLQLQRVLDNLLGNACKFTPPGGQIRVRLDQRQHSAVLEVSDTGIGIPQDQLDHIFERFYQVDGSTTRRYSGTGLGLALVKEIVQAHRGRVTVESTVGEGSTFRVTLPLTVRL
jgi:PAS domain S-box-containing protein